MLKNDLIFDIDDVIRNLKDNIIPSLNLYYNGRNWGDYNYHNPKIRDFFMWYRKQSFYHQLYENCEYNLELGEYVDKLIDRGVKVRFLSSNDNTKAIEITLKFLEANLKGFSKVDVHFVDKASYKIDFVLNHGDIDPERVIFVDDRGDTCLDFQKNNIKTFWYTKYNRPDCWITHFPELENGMPHGGTFKLIEYIESEF